MESRNPYDTDLTDSEWDQLQPLVPAAKPGGRPAKHARREILNGIFYIVRSGSAWKLLPHDLPPWRTVYHYFWSWRRDGTWQTVHNTPCGHWSGKPPVEKLNPAELSWIARRSGRANKVAHAATTVPRRFAAANGICWWTRSDWCCGW